MTGGGHAFTLCRPTRIRRRGLLQLADLNMLVAPAYAWLWSVSGDAAAIASRPMAIFAGAIDSANLTRSKQFNQNWPGSRHSRPGGRRGTSQRADRRGRPVRPRCLGACSHIASTSAPHRLEQHCRSQLLRCK